MQAKSQKNGTKTGQSDNIFSISELIFANAKKKMHTNLISHENLKIKYIPAELKINKSCWYIEYYVLNPFSDNLERQRIKVNYLRKKIKDNNLAKRELKLYCNAINIKLASGWSPFENNKNIEYITLVKLCDNFLSIKQKELRPESIRAYNSHIGMFKGWLISNKLSTILACDFSKKHSLNYMDSILNKNISNRQWNNYKMYLRIFFNWLIDRNYCNTNYFATMNKKQEEKKKRTIIPKNERLRLFNYLKENNKPFLIFVLLEYACLMRPIEIFRTKISDYDLKNQVINLNGNQTKNKKPRQIVIPDIIFEEIKKYFETLNVNDNNKEYYLFSKDYKIGKELMNTRVSGRTWQQVRIALNFPAEYQLYSLRDTAITEMLLNNISAKVVQKHADHHDLTITSRYANHVTPQMNKEIKENFPEF